MHIEWGFPFVYLNMNGGNIGGVTVNKARISWRYWPVQLNDNSLRVELSGVHFNAIADESGQVKVASFPPVQTETTKGNQKRLWRLIDCIILHNTTGSLQLASGKSVLIRLPHMRACLRNDENIQLFAEIEERHKRGTIIAHGQRTPYGDYHVRAQLKQLSLPVWEIGKTTLPVIDDLSAELSMQWRNEQDWDMTIRDVAFSHSPSDQSAPPHPIHISAMRFNFRPHQLGIYASHFNITSLTKAALAYPKIIPQDAFAAIKKLSPQGNLKHINITLPPDKPLQLVLTGRLDGVEAQPWRGAPGVKNIYGYIRATAYSGVVEYDTPDGHLVFPLIYHHSLDFYDHISGRVHWKIYPNQRVIVRGERLRSKQKDDAHGIGNFRLNVVIGKKRQEKSSFELMVGFSNIDGLKAKSTYMPYVLPPIVQKWLNDNILAGHVTQGGVIFRDEWYPDHAAHLATPLDRHARFNTQLFIKLKDGQIRYLPKAPIAFADQSQVMLDNYYLQFTTQHLKSTSPLWELSGPIRGTIRFARKGVTASNPPPTTKIHVHQIDAFLPSLKQSINNMSAVITGKGNSWLASVSHPRLTASLRIQKDSPRRLRIKKLYLPLMQAKQNATPKKSVILDPNKWMDMDVSVDQLKVGLNDYKNLSFSIRTYPNGIGFHHLQADYMHAHLGGIGKGTHLSWYNTSNTQYTAIKSDVLFGDVRELLQLTGFKPFVVSASGRLSFDLSWQGNPLQFELAQSTGEAHLEISELEILNPPPSLQKIFHFFRSINIRDNVSRTLKGDPEILRFTTNTIQVASLKSKLVFKNGYMSMVDPVQLRSASGAMRMLVKLNLANNHIDGWLVKEVPIWRNLPWYALLLQQIPIAVQLYFIAKIPKVGDFLKRFSTIRYNLAGTLEDPDLNIAGMTSK